MRMIAGAVAATLALPALLASCASAPAAAPLDDELLRSIRGEYRLTDGRHLLVGGWPRSPTIAASTFVLIDDQRFRVVHAGSRRFIGDGGLEIIFDSAELPASAPGAVLVSPGKPEQRAVRIRSYDEIEMRFEGSGVALGGTLLLPPSARPMPAVVVVHGSGAHTREVYREIGDAFARRGVAALIYDKRGTGESAGDHRSASFDDLAGDALAAVEALRREPRVDPARVGLWGLSQGGWVAPLAAVSAPSVAFLITVSASARSPATQERWRIGNTLSARGWSDAAIAVAGRAQGAVVAMGPVLSRTPASGAVWSAHLDPDLDPIPTWAALDRPVLALWGERDGVVPAIESARAIERALAAGGNTRRDIRVLPGADHFLLGAERGDETEQRSTRTYVAGYLAGMAEWITTGHPGREALSLPDTPSTTLRWRLSPTTPAHEVPLTVASALLALIGSVATLTLARGGRWSTVAGFVTVASLVALPGGAIAAAMLEPPAAALGAPAVMLIAPVLTVAAVVLLLRARSVAVRRAWIDTTLLLLALSLVQWLPLV